MFRWLFMAFRSSPELTALILNQSIWCQPWRRCWESILPLMPLDEFLLRHWFQRIEQKTLRARRPKSVSIHPIHPTLSDQSRLSLAEARGDGFSGNRASRS